MMCKDLTCRYELLLNVLTLIKAALINEFYINNGTNDFE